MMIRMKFLYSIFLFASLSLLGINPKEASKKVWSNFEINIPPQEHLWISKCEIPSKDIQKELTSSKKLEKDYKRARELSKYFNRSTNIGHSPENLLKNRYHTVTPFDDVRTLRGVPGFYFSGSDVVTSEQTYIVTSAPLSHTITDFWKAIIATRTTTVVKLMASSEVSSNAPLYHGASFMPHHIDDWTVELKKQQILAQSILKPKQMIVEKIFTAKRKDGKTHKIRHLHYENWPDGGSPDIALFYRLLELVDEQQKSSDPILVHCMAGVGRSGTFVLGHTLRKMIIRNRKEKNSLNVIKTFLTLRMQRDKLVSNTGQFLSAVKIALIEYEKGIAQINQWSMKP